MDYSKMTLAQLRAEAKERGLKGISALKKDDLIRVLEENESTSPSFSEKENVEIVPSVKVENREVTDNSNERNSEEKRYEAESKIEEGKAYSEQVAETSSYRGDRQTKTKGILELVEGGFGFIRCDNYLSGENDVYVSHSQIRKFNLKTGDILCGSTKFNSPNDKFAALVYIDSVNGYKPYEAQKRKNFEDLTPIFPNEKIHLESPGGPVSMRMLDLLSPIGKGQRGMIVSQPKTGKTTLLKQIAKSIIQSSPNIKLIVLLIDERPEEVTDIRESIEGENAEVIYSTFDELPEHHRKVSEMVLERAKRLVEHQEDVVILLDSITRLARAYNLLVPPSGRTLSGGLDPAALHMPKKFFGAARNMREGGSLTILATALVDTGSKMDDVVFEEFKGTGNMEVVLDRKLSEKRIFPAINIQKSGTRREDLLLTKEEMEVGYALHREMAGPHSEESMEQILRIFKNSRTNQEFIATMKSSLLRNKDRM
ncbi:MAG: transcription termination factor Rho [Eubacteriales bacterium]|nr:transcription termination factor Rho [Eubacteriales bacterium]